ncbi:VOC family protein [Pseudomonas cavernae]|uniref:VOC family protein n=1 Tax=Pseudomonas cavernae TaxID=2320867 RepID=A0A385Z7A0_9PSED|nr:VOC family protein [Pseudomonas cavernae]AYC35026.1 VOC family protein [Pseudomonas cavernae]
MFSKPVGWFEIYVQDMPRAKAFYQAVFATQLEKLESPDPALELWAFPGPMDDSNGASGALVRMADGPTGIGGTLVYFMCEDCATEAGRVVANGGTVMREKFAIGQYGFIALVTDTEGNLIGLHSMR